MGFYALLGKDVPFKETLPLTLSAVASGTALGKGCGLSFLAVYSNRSLYT